MGTLKTLKCTTAIENTFRARAVFLMLFVSVRMQFQTCLPFKKLRYPSLFKPDIEFDINSLIAIIGFAFAH